MSASNLDSHGTMRGRDVNKVARGEQAPRPVHETGTVSKPPPPSQVDPNRGRHDNDDHDPAGDQVVEAETAPADMRFPSTNQTRHCYARYLDYHKCIQEKGKEAPECDKFAKHYRSLCPSEWIERWNEQRAEGKFPAPT